MKYQNKRVFVTGCAGFIGSHLTEKLLELGASVVGLDNFQNGLVENLDIFRKNPKFQFYPGDVRDGSFLIEITKNIDVIFHEAALVSVPQSISMPQLNNDINVGGVFNVLNAARINNVERVVFASSAAIYGDDPILPKHEKMYSIPISPYGVAKLTGENYLMAFNNCYGIKTTALRYFNVYGPRQRNGAYAGVMAIFIEQILKTGAAPTIFGDGSQTRDFIYVKDIVKANLLAGISPNSPGQIFNVATGNTTSLNSLTKLILKFTNREDLEIKYAPARTGDILHSSADTTKIKTMLEFNPDYSIETGLAEYIEFQKKKFQK